MAIGAPTALGRQLRRDSSLQSGRPGSCATNSQTVNGQPSDRCCRTRPAACRVWMIGVSGMASFGCSGAPWGDRSSDFGPYTTYDNRFVRWRRAGVWSRIMEALAAAHAAAQMIDTSIVHVHQHGRPASALRGFRGAAHRRASSDRYCAQGGGLRQSLPEENASAIDARLPDL
jgi:transposase